MKLSPADGTMTEAGRTDLKIVGNQPMTGGPKTQNPPMFRGILKYTSTPDTPLSLRNQINSNNAFTVLSIPSAASEIRAASI